MKTKQKAIFYVVLIFIVLFVFFLPSIRSFVNNSINGELIKKVENEALGANVEIVEIEHETGVNSYSSSYNAGSSGVIIGREGDKYYALTAGHVVETFYDDSDAEFIIMQHDDLDFMDYLDQGGQFQGISNYYQQFSKVTVEYCDSRYDLAVVSFTSEDDLTVLSIANGNPEYGDTIVAMGNPDGEKNVISTGRVISRKPMPFGDKDGEMQYSVIRHTAMLAEGSSGSALLNVDLEVAGINLGGSENIFRRFLAGIAMPAARINEFLEGWENSSVSDFRK